MENQFAKLFNFPDGQLLVTLTYCSRSRSLKLMRKTKLNGVPAELFSGFKTDEHAHQAFGAYDETEADKDFTYIKNVLKD